MEVNMLGRVDKETNRDMNGYVVRHVQRRDARCQQG